MTAGKAVLRSPQTGQMKTPLRYRISASCYGSTPWRRSAASTSSIGRALTMGGGAAHRAMKMPPSPPDGFPPRLVVGLAGGDIALDFWSGERAEPDLADNRGPLRDPSAAGQ